MELKNKHFSLSINEKICDCVILQRTKNIGKKPPYYIFDLTRHCYISSLKPTDKKDTFNFDVRLKNENNIFYSMQISDTGKIELNLL